MYVCKTTYTHFFKMISGVFPVGSYAEIYMLPTYIHCNLYIGTHITKNTFRIYSLYGFAKVSYSYDKTFTDQGMARHLQVKSREIVTMMSHTNVLLFRTSPTHWTSMNCE